MVFHDTVLDLTSLFNFLGGPFTPGWSTTGYSTQHGGITKCC